MLPSLFCCESSLPSVTCVGVYSLMHAPLHHHMAVIVVHCHESTGVHDVLSCMLLGAAGWKLRLPDSCSGVCCPAVPSHWALLVQGML